MCNFNARSKRENGEDNIFVALMADNFPKLMTDTKP